MTNVPVEVRKAVPAPTPARLPDTWRSFRQEMDRLFDRFTGFGLPGFRRLLDVEPTWTYESSFSFPTPAVDVTEGDKDFKVTAELPGLEEKNIEVTVSNHTLTIRGEKSYEKEEKNKDHHVSERAYGTFQRSFTVPEGVDADKITAELAKGVLTVSLPKTAEAQKPAKKIEVKAAA
jgi:HSP20 family protein